MSCALQLVHAALLIFTRMCWWVHCAALACATQHGGGNVLLVAALRVHTLSVLPSARHVTVVHCVASQIVTYNGGFMVCHKACVFSADRVHILLLISNTLVRFVCLSAIHGNMRVQPCCGAGATHIRLTTVCSACLRCLSSGTATPHGRGWAVGEDWGFGATYYAY
jgi:hypothetical protein